MSAATVSEPVATAKLPNGQTVELASVGKDERQVFALQPLRVGKDAAGNRWTPTAKALKDIQDGTTQRDDPFQGRYLRGATGTTLLEPIQPDTPLDWLARLAHHSNILGPCLTAYGDNIAGHGYRLVPRVEPGSPEAETNKAAIEDERIRLVELLDHIHYTLSLEEVRGQARLRGEAVGFGGWEVVTDSEGRPALLEPVFPQLLRLCPVDPEVVEWDQPVWDQKAMQWRMRKVPRKFRRYVSTTRVDRHDFVYLKEYGDPRVLGHLSGTFYADEGAMEAANRKRGRKGKQDRAANAFLRFDVMHLDGAYPLPRWAGFIDEIIGSIYANELNHSRFENPIPPLMVTVSGGTLAEVSKTIVQEAFAESVDFKSAPLVIAAEPMKGGASAYAGIGGAPSVKIEVVPLDRVIADDGLYQAYDANNRDKVRSAFNLTRMATGELPDLNRASAQAGEDHDEEMVYAPHRKREDRLIFDRTLLPAWGIRWWKVESLATPGLGDEDLPELLSGAVNSHALTVNEHRTVLARRLRVDLAPIGEPWANVPPKKSDAGIVDPEMLGEPPAAPTGPVDGGGNGGTGSDGSGSGRDEDGERVEQGERAAKAAVIASSQALRMALDALAGRADGDGSA